MLSIFDTSEEAGAQVQHATDHDVYTTVGALARRVGVLHHNICAATSANGHDQSALDAIEQALGDLEAKAAELFLGNDTADLLEASSNIR